LSSGFMHRHLVCKLMVGEPNIWRYSLYNFPVKPLFVMPTSEISLNGTLLHLHSLVKELVV
jgi:hypothetical protein